MKTKIVITLFSYMYIFKFQVKAPMDRYDGKSTSVWLDIYVMVHFLIISASYQELLVRSGVSIKVIVSSSSFHAGPYTCKH